MNREQFQQILNEYYSHSPPCKFALAIDFDDTLCYSRYPFCGKETPVAKFIKSIQDLDYIQIIYTCRHSGGAMMQCKKWLKDHNIRYDYYNENDATRISLYGECRKIAVNMLIDNCSYDFDMNDFE